MAAWWCCGAGRGRSSRGSRGAPSSSHRRTSPSGSQAWLPFDELGPAHRQDPGLDELARRLHRDAVIGGVLLAVVEAEQRLRLDEPHVRVADELDAGFEEEVDLHLHGGDVLLVAVELVRVVLRPLLLVAVLLKTRDEDPGQIWRDDDVHVLVVVEELVLLVGRAHEVPGPAAGDAGAQLS